MSMFSKLAGIFGLNLLFLSIASSQISNRQQGSCGFNATATTKPQTLTSPGWPENYIDNTSCIWTITADSPGRIIQLEFSTFKTEHCCDYLRIYENGEEVQRLRGTEQNFQFVSTTNQIELRFAADLNVNFEGFEGTFQSLRTTNLGPTISNSFETTTASAISWTSSRSSIVFVIFLFSSFCLTSHLA